jgi:RNA polymerase sigma-70 factor, ECF subfamily
MEQPMSLLERFTKGDPAAFEELFRQFQGKVYAWIVRVVRDPAAAEDLTVETFWRIHRARGRFDSQKDFAGWAYRIATNLALSHLRYKPLQQLVPEQMAADDPRDPALQAEVKEKIQDAVAKLPPKLQLAVTMALIEDRPYREIAEALGIAEGTVKSRVFRAVRILRKKLGKLRVTP